MIDSTALCVDLDGSLIRTDLLHEATLLLIKHSPVQLLAIPFWLARGKAALKAHIADRVSPEASLLPYNEALLAWLQEQRSAGRRLVLCTASDRRYAQKVADYLGIFDLVIASDGQKNNSAANKAAALMEQFGEGAYDYVGNSSADLPVWKGARRAIVVGDDGMRAAAARVTNVERVFALDPAGPRAWLKGLRLHQWLKNVLLVLPLLGAHRWGDAPALLQVLGAFFAFGMCASAVYVINDLFDLESDRQHLRKRLRPFASGRISIPQGFAVAIVLLALAFILAAAVSLAFFEWLLVYLVLTKAYTFFLKSIPLLDCLTLAGLYTLRVVAGGAAAAQPVSFWLLAFCLFLFLSLAFVKRYSELVAMAARGKMSAHGRGYVAEDRQLLQSFGVSAGFASALVLALYLNSEAVLQLYTHPDRLWFTLPALLFWISWMWLLASRGQMHDDPVIFAVRNRVSLLAGVVFLAVIWLAK
jgi:4-hydroxybenzoate polyprenyltransferase/phosphoglycolate phosphatase-like HAD superfamily hydrolase